ncbi:hypothetical protein QZH41_008615 [Actinostola sp. cb2023]|nr:hypothetical protein QZH41_008615 [Actinostola sp. cb2023]
MSGRIGGLLAPYVDLLANLPSIDTSVPVIIFAILCICGAVVTYWIPETINANMHQTIEEVEAAQESYDIFCCKKPSKLAQEVQLESSEGEKMLDAKEI